MDIEPKEQDVIDIDILDPIGDDSVIILKDVEETAGDDTGTPISVSGNEITGTGTLISKVFDLIAQAKGRDLWRLEDQEIKSLNNTCPKILPQILREHTGLIACILSLGGIILKRIKIERSLVEDTMIQASTEPETEPEPKSLTGGRSG